MKTEPNKNRYKVTDAETGNWNIGEFRRIDSAINFAEKNWRQDNDGTHYTVYDNKLERDVYHTQYGQLI